MMECVPSLQASLKSKLQDKLYYTIAILEFARLRGMDDTLFVIQHFACYGLI